jgi:hypothetical protein
MFDHDRPTIGVADEQLPQPHPALGHHVHAPLAHRAADDGTTRTASDAQRFGAATGG